MTRVFQESFKVVSRIFQGCFKKVSWVIHESFKEEEVSRMFQGFFIIFKGIPRVCQWRFKEVSRKLSRCFKKCFMLHGTHRSFPSRRRACSLHPTLTPAACLRRHRSFLALDSPPPLVRKGVSKIKNGIKIECTQYCCKINLHLTDKLFKRMITENFKINFIHVSNHPTRVVSLGNKLR